MATKNHEIVKIRNGIARQLRESTLRYYCLDTSRPTTAGREEAS